MSFVKIIRPDDARGTLKDLYAKLSDKRGKIAEVHMAQSLNPNVLTKHMQLYVASMFGQSSLSRAEREMIAIVVSATNKCRYCIEHHRHALNHFWQDDMRIEKLTESKFDACLLTKREHLICQYAQKLTTSPSSLSDKDIDLLHKATLSDRDIVDAVGVISYFNYVNRVVLGLGVKLEVDGSDGYIY